MRTGLAEHLYQPPVEPVCVISIDNRGTGCGDNPADGYDFDNMTKGAARLLESLAAIFRHVLLPFLAGDVTPYAISKAGVVQMTKALALEWARHRIRVNALAPGYIETELNDDVLHQRRRQGVDPAHPATSPGRSEGTRRPVAPASLRRRFLHDWQRYRG